MKTRYLYLTAIIFLFTCFACTEEIIDPVDTCQAGNFDNENYPDNELYKLILDEYVANGFPGISLAIETPDYGWWVGSAGFARIEDEVAMTPCHLHHAAFVTNIYTATLVMRLVEMRKLDLDDPIREYLDDEIVENVANADVATIRHLMNGTSGIMPYDDNLKMYVDGFNDPSVQTSAKYMLENYIYGQPAYSEAGEKRNSWGYTDYDLLGMIIEEASGMTLKAFFEQEIVDAIGLTSTYFNEYPGPDDEDLTANSYFEHFPGKLQNISELQNNYSKIGMGSMGVLATPYEYARFLQELMRGNILEAASLTEILPTEEKLGMGIFKFRGDERFRDIHGGSYGQDVGTLGVSIIVIYFPDPDITMVLSANIGGIFDSETADSFWTGLLMDIISVTYTGERY